MIASARPSTWLRRFLTRPLVSSAVRLSEAVAGVTPSSCATADNVRLSRRDAEQLEDLALSGCQALRRPLIPRTGVGELRQTPQRARQSLLQGNRNPVEGEHKRRA